VPTMQPPVSSISSRATISLIPSACVPPRSLPWRVPPLIKVYCGGFVIQTAGIRDGRPCYAKRAFQHHEPIRALRCRVILTVCYATGLRISEAVRLKPSAIDSKRMVIRVEQGKGRKDHVAAPEGRLRSSYWRRARTHELSGLSGLWTRPRATSVGPSTCFRSR
jgi:hypothetical protein